MEFGGCDGEPWKVLVVTEWTVAILPSDQCRGRPWEGHAEPVAVSWPQPDLSLAT